MNWTPAQNERREGQPRSQDLFPSLGAGREKALFCSVAPKLGKRSWERGCARGWGGGREERTSRFALALLTDFLAFFALQNREAVNSLSKRNLYTMNSDV